MEIMFEKIARAVDIALSTLYFGLRADQILFGLLYLLYGCCLQGQQGLHAVVIPLCECRSRLRFTEISNRTPILRA